MEKITEYLIRSTVHTSEVRAWEEDILLPTYGIGEEEKNPIFLEKRVYQGSSGAVYPYPVVEKICDEKRDKSYRALFLENEYLKLMILPELGGRVHMAYDKVKQRHFVYYNQVIKPALVGLTGPWISGGIEFNWPQHHRPSTFLPTEYAIEEHADGSKTIWCNEVERMFRTKGTQGFRLYPGKAYLEINVRIYNRTAFPQTFLWWANPAVVVNEHYHSVFPPDVHAVFDHGKRDVSSFPIATGTYYKEDYSAGVDISRYKNIPVPTSYMAIQSKYDFVGGYEADVQGGLLHVADHHVSPGKKQWTWGNGDFGVAWDRNLTDEDGPYIELMTGVYTDNQPDFSWLQPYEEKSWQQYFMPYSEVGYVKNATKDAILHLSLDAGNASLVLYTTAINEGIRITVRSTTGQVLFEQTTDITPADPFKASFPATGCSESDLIAEIRTADNALLLTYQAEEPVIKPLPESAKAAKDPKDIASIEQLFLTGLHLEQYRHATYNPLDYYNEALRREPGDVRCNNAIGLLLMRKGQFAQAEPYFHKAIETLTGRNPNPYDGEPYYNLGWSCKMQGKYDEAYDAFFKATWNAAWKDAGHYALAQIDCLRGHYPKALFHAGQSLIRNWHNHKARQLKASLLRKLGQKEEASALIAESLKIDRFNIGIRFESGLLTGSKAVHEEMNRLLQHRVHTYIEYALDFVGAGLYDEAIGLLNEYIHAHTTVYPLAHYIAGYCYSCKGEKDVAQTCYRQAAREDHAYCFPNRLEEVVVLQDVMTLDPNGCAGAAYALGNYWYANRQYADAVACWETAATLNPDFPTVWRNLSLAYYNKQHQKSKALEALEKAFRLNTTDARILMELDQLYKRLGYPYAQRLAFLEQYPDLVASRDDLSIERITLYNQLGRYEEARALIASRHFHPWEGGEGKITGQYTLCRIELAKQAIRESHFTEALALLKETESYPHNLGEGKLKNAEENDSWYFKGIACLGVGEKAAETEAQACFARAVVGASEPQQAFFYNDQQPDKILYQGLAWRALGKEDRARSCFNKLIKHGEKHLFDTCRINYFAVSLPDLAIWDDDLDKRNRIHCNYVMGLGNLGLGETDKATAFFRTVLALDINHQGAQTHLTMCSES